MDEKIVKDSQGLAKDLVNDCISRKEAIDALRTHERKASKKWFDNQLDIEWNNAIDICCYDIEDLPSVQPEIVRCGQCKYAEVADTQDNQDGYTCQFHRGSIWFSGSYCSWGERRTDA